MKFYVYELVRVSDGKVLYVGKGSGNRINQHRKRAKRILSKGPLKGYPQLNLYSALADVIRTGDDFTARKVFESDSEFTALYHESELILYYGIENLLNDTFIPVFWPKNPEEVAAARASLRWKAIHRKQNRDRKKKDHKREQQRDLKRAKSREEERAKERKEWEIKCSGRRRSRQRERQAEVDRLVQLKLKFGSKHEWTTRQEWYELRTKMSTELSNTGAQDACEPDLKCRRIRQREKDREKEWEKELLTRKVAAPTAADFAWGTAKYAPARQFFDFIFTPG